MQARMKNYEVMVQLVWCALNLLNTIGIGNFFGKHAGGTTAQAFALENVNI